MKFLATLERRASSAAVALVDGQDRVLVVKAHYKPYWSFPGGIVDPGETPRETATREVVEEVGIILAVEDLVFRFVVNRVSEIAQTYQFVFEAILSSSHSVSVKLDPKEIDATEWVTKEQIIDADRDYSQSVILWARGFEDGYNEQVFGGKEANH